jgi:hypothetical protein
MNREVHVRICERPGVKLLGPTRQFHRPTHPFRYSEDLEGREWRYLNGSPSEKALKQDREKLHEMTNHRQCCQPIPELIQGLNRHLKGWKNYFDFGYPRVAFREINTYVRDRLTQHLRRRSQRPFLPPEGVSYYEQIHLFGLGAFVVGGSRATACACLRRYVFRRAECREICLCGSMRGEWVAPQGVAFSPTLPNCRENLDADRGSIAAAGIRRFVSGKKIG